MGIQIIIFQVLIFAPNDLKIYNILDILCKINILNASRPLNSPNVLVHKSISNLHFLFIINYNKQPL